MGFTFQESASNFSSASGRDLDTSTTLNVSIGDLLVGIMSWDGAVTAAGAMYEDDDSSNQLTLLTEQNDGSTNLQMGWVIATSANATATFRMDPGANRSYRNIIVLRFTYSGGTPEFEDGGDAASDGSGTGEASTSGNISITSSDSLAIAAVSWYSSTNSETGFTIGGQAADGNIEVSQYLWVWYEAFSSNQTDINAYCEWSGSVDWLTDVFALDNVGATTTTGAPTTTTTTTTPAPAGMTVPIISKDGIHSAVFGGQIITG